MLRLAIPVPHPPGEVALAVTRLTRRLRWWRERSGRRLSDVAFFGIVSGDVAHALVVYPEVTRGDLRDALRCLPTVTTFDDIEVMPADRLCVPDIVALAKARRGIEPLRFYVGPVIEKSRAIAAARTLEPMPVSFSGPLTPLR